MGMGTREAAGTTVRAALEAWDAHLCGLQSHSCWLVAEEKPFGDIQGREVGKGQRTPAHQAEQSGTSQTVGTGTDWQQHPRPTKKGSTTKKPTWRGSLLEQTHALEGFPHTDTAEATLGGGLT